MAGRLRFWEVGAEGDDAALLRNEEVNEKAYEQRGGGGGIDAVTVRGGDRGQRGPTRHAVITIISHSPIAGHLGPLGRFRQKMTFLKRIEGLTETLIHEGTPNHAHARHKEVRIFFFQFCHCH
jgi:hypothetical protein